jgi:hypothetical protein
MPLANRAIKSKVQKFGALGKDRVAFVGNTTDPTDLGGEISGL